MLNLLRDKRYAWIPAAATATLVLATVTWLLSGVLDFLELRVYDRAARSSTAAPPSDIAIIAIDDASIAKLGAWPWPRSMHTRLLERLTEGGTALVAFAMPLSDSPSESQRRSGLDQLRAAIKLLDSAGEGNSEQSERLKALLGKSVTDLDEDTGLSQAIERHGNVLLAAEAQLDGDSKNLEVTDVRRPAPSLASRSRGIGHIAFRADRDGVIRSDVSVVDDGEHPLPSLGLAVAARQNGVEIGQLAVNGSTVELGAKRLRLDAQGRWRSRFYPSSGPRSIPRYSYWEVLSGAVPVDRLQGKTVLIGQTNNTAPVLRTPIGEQSAVVVAAGMAASIAVGDDYRLPAWGPALQWVVAIAMVALCAWLFPSLNVWISGIAAMLLIAALILVEIGTLNLTGTWLKLVAPAFAVLGAFLGVIAAVAAKRQIRPNAGNGDAIGSLRMLGQTFQGQGQLDLALETFRRCPMDTQTIDLLYELGQDFERRHQFAKAAEVYSQIGSAQAGYKDVAQRRERMKRAQMPQAAPAAMRSKAAAAPRRPIVAAAPPRAAVEDFEPVVRKAVSKQTLGRYEIERELGKGAMGVVYLGRDPKINRVVAIKAIALAEEFAEEDLADARARFFREAEMAGRLNHPGIVTVYDAGEDRGLAYIAMEFLRGEHLSHYAEAIRLLPVARVLALVARVADALDYAHRQNVVHRDIKPANIMFNADTDELKLTDFGIARLTDTSRTKTGIVLGTPSFMSPEQLEGRPLDGRSDLFSLGITLYQLLTGQLPFRAESMTRLMHKIAVEPHVPVRSLRPELPELAEQIMSQALAKSALDRYQTGAEMAVALRTCIRLVTRKEAIAR